jgi:hypothetical protein
VAEKRQGSIAQWRRVSRIKRAEAPGLSMGVFLTGIKSGDLTVFQEDQGVA